MQVPGAKVNRAATGRNKGWVPAIRPATLKRDGAAVGIDGAGVVEERIQEDRRTISARTLGESARVVSGRSVIVVVVKVTVEIGVESASSLIVKGSVIEGVNVAGAPVDSPGVVDGV